MNVPTDRVFYYRFVEVGASNIMRFGVAEPDGVESAFWGPATDGWVTDFDLAAYILFDESALERITLDEAQAITGGHATDDAKGTYAAVGPDPGDPFDP